MLATALLSGAALLGGGDGAPGFHAFAAVNDARSHGQVGDALLSINEAIRLHNNTLLFNQLSPAEQAQVLLIPGTGTSTFLSWARFDGSLTPVITVEQDLDVIVNTSYGLFLSSDNGPTTLDFSGANVTRGMRATTNSLQMRDFIFSGGPYGIDVVQTDIAGQIGFAINDCRFENHSQFGVRISTTTPNGFGKGYLERCVFDNAPTGIVWGAAVAGRTSFFDLHDCRFTGVDRGVEITLGNGGIGRYTLNHLVIDAAVEGIVLDRPSGATQAAQINARHVEVRAPDCATIDCSPTGATTLMLQMLHLWSTTPTGTALALGAAGDNVSGRLEDSTFEGDVAVRTGGGAAALTLANLRARDGSVAFEASPAQAMALSDSRFDNCAVSVTGSTAIPFANCCFASSSVAGTAASPVLCTDSWVPSPGAHVSSTSPRSQEQLGGMRVLPDVPTIGSTVLFEADLPAGLFGVFLLGFTEQYPNLLPQPLHVYSVFNNTFLLPGIFRFQQSFPWTIPNFPIYIGMDLVATIAVLPDPGVGALPVQIAPGRRFALQ